eukprot:753457-Hanusia_phi.AAC.4
MSPTSTSKSVGDVQTRLDLKLIHTHLSSSADPAPSQLSDLLCRLSRPRSQGSTGSRRRRCARLTACRRGEEGGMASPSLHHAR